MEDGNGGEEMDQQCQQHERSKDEQIILKMGG